MRLFSRNSLCLAIFSLTIFLTASFTRPESDRGGRVASAFHEHLEKYSAAMLAALHEFKNEAVTDKPFSPEQVSVLKKKFIEVRKAYKKIEPFSCYYFLASERNFNGPVVPEIEDESEPHPKIEMPHGLQVMESYLWDEEPGKYRQQLINEIALMDENLSALSIAFKTVPTDEVKFVEALQLEVIRIFTLGISQFDTQDSKNSIAEAEVSLEAILEVFSAAYGKESAKPQVIIVKDQLNTTISYFKNIESPEKIDFISCYRNQYIPLSKAFFNLRIYFVENNYFPSSAINFTAPSIFQKDAFNRFFYNPRGTDPAFSSAAAALGKSLFFDPILSANDKRSCASCHQPERAFTDGLKTSIGFLEGEVLTRNAPTIINAALQRNYFYDMRADHLEGQIGHVLTNKNEMQSSFETAVKKLKENSAYVLMFSKAFKGTSDTLISKSSIENAISEYERTLISLDSKFDRNIRGDEKSFTEEEKAGFNVFMNKGRCATCHYLPLFNNVVPPQYTRSEFEILGTTRTPDLQHPELDPDPGRGGLYGTEIFMHAFKTPTLRNISLTPPYMHNGAFETLEQVIEFYNKGGGAGLGLKVPNQTLPSDSLSLTEKEKKSLVIFLNTLTDTVNMTSVPHQDHFRD